MYFNILIMPGPNYDPKAKSWKEFFSVYVLFQEAQSSAVLQSWPYQVFFNMTIHSFSYEF